MPMKKQICKICNIEKDVLCYRRQQSGSFRKICKRCEYDKYEYKHRKPKKEVPEEILKRREYDKLKKREKALKEKNKWLNDLYQYIVYKNIFTERELEIIYKWLEVVNKLGDIK